MGPSHLWLRCCQHLHPSLPSLWLNLGFHNVNRCSGTKGFRKCQGSSQLSEIHSVLLLIKNSEKVLQKRNVVQHFPSFVWTQTTFISRKTYFHFNRQNAAQKFEQQNWLNLGTVISVILGKSCNYSVWGSVPSFIKWNNNAFTGILWGLSAIAHRLYPTFSKYSVNMSYYSLRSPTSQFLFSPPPLS